MPEHDDSPPMKGPVGCVVSRWPVAPTHLRRHLKQTHGRKPACRQTNTSEIVRAAVLDGVGIAYLPTWLLQGLIDTNDAQVLLPDWQTIPLPLHSVSPAGLCDVANVRTCGEHLPTALVDCAACQ